MDRSEIEVIKVDCSTCIHNIRERCSCHFKENITNDVDVKELIKEYPFGCDNYFITQDDYMDEIKYHKDYFSKRMFDIRHYKNFDKKILTGNEIHNYLKNYNEKYDHDFKSVKKEKIDAFDIFRNIKENEQYLFFNLDNFNKMRFCAIFDFYENQCLGYLAYQ